METSILINGVSLIFLPKKIAIYYPIITTHTRLINNHQIQGQKFIKGSNWIAVVICFGAVIVHIVVVV